MGVGPTPSGRWRARLKHGREVVASKTFDTKREASAWLARERAALAGGIDPRAGKVLVRRAFAQWLVDREGTVATWTTKADRSVAKVLPPFLANVNISAVTDREVLRCIHDWSRRYAESTVRRYRATLMAFFASCVRDRLIATNPVTATKVPRQLTPPVEMQPLSRTELEQVRDQIAEHHPALADAVWLAGWTGLRWSELRELRVGDFVERPVPRLVIRRAQPEGVRTKRPKSNKSRHVRWSMPSCRWCASWWPASRPTTYWSPPAPGAGCTPRRSSGRRTGRSPAGVGGCTTCGTPRRACGWRRASPPPPSRRGWGTPI